MARRLLLINGFAIFCVILFHAAGWGITSLFMWTHRYLPVVSPNFDQAGTAWDIVFRLVEQFTVFSIPGFIFVSGCFIAIMNSSDSMKTDWKRLLLRIRNLLIPYLIWTGLILIGRIIQGRDLQVEGLIKILLTGSVNEAYYFVPLLTQLYLLSPFIYRLARIKPRLLLTFSGMIVALQGMLSVGLVLRSDSVFLVSVSDILPKWFFPVRLFWFALGMTFIMYISRITPVIRRMRWWLLIGAVGTFLIGVLEWEWLLRASGQLWAPHRETLVDSFFTLFVILGILAFSEIRIPLANQLMEIGARSYGIYLVHPPVMEYFSRGIYHLAPALLSYQIFLQSSLIFVGLAIPLGMMYFVRRSRARSLYPILFG